MSEKEERRQISKMNTYAGSLFLSVTMKPRMFDLDFQLLHDAVLTLVAVFVLYLALSYFLFNPVRDMLKKRQDKIAAKLAEAADAEAQALVLREEYEVKLADIHREAEEILSDTRKRALAGENQIIIGAKQEARRILDRAHVEAELEKSKVTDEVKAEMIHLAFLLAGKMIAVNINADMQKRLVDETLKEMSKRTWQS